MRLLCDANIGSTVARALAAEGHDVVRAAHLGARVPDGQVLAAAVAEQRVLITCDSAFGDLVFHRGHRPPPSIIFVRFEPEDVRDIAPRILAVLETERLMNHMIVIDDRQVRRRPFTRTSEHHV